MFEFGDKNSKPIAYLAHSQYISASIPHNYDENLMLCTSPEDIAQVFTIFYSCLYSSRVGYEMEEVHQFLAAVPLPVLAREAAEDLDLHISAKETEAAIQSFHPKNMGLRWILDVRCATLHTKHFLLEVYTNAFDRGVLWDSLREAFIVPIPKAHKGHQFCEPYRPISLMKMQTFWLSFLRDG